MTDSLGKSQSKDKAITLTVTEKTMEAPKVPLFKNTQTVVNGKRVTFTFAVENLPPEVEKFKISYGETPETMNKEALTFSTGKIQNADGLFQWYIDGLEPKSYVFKIYAVKSDGTLVANLSSEALSGTIGNTTCTIGDV